MNQMIEEWDTNKATRGQSLRLSDAPEKNNESFNLDQQKVVYEYDFIERAYVKYVLDEETNEWVDADPEAYYKYDHFSGKLQPFSVISPLCYRGEI